MKIRHFSCAFECHINISTANLLFPLDSMCVQNSSEMVFLSCTCTCHSTVSCFYQRLTSFQQAFTSCFISFYILGMMILLNVFLSCIVNFGSNLYSKVLNASVCIVERGFRLAIMYSVTFSAAITAVYCLLDTSLVLPMLL